MQPSGDRRSGAGDGRCGRSRRHSSNDILVFSRDFPRPRHPMSTPAPLPDRRQLADVSRVSRDARLRPDRSRRKVHPRRLHLRDDAAQADRRSPAAVHRRVVRSRRPDVPLRDGDRLQGQPRADAARSRRADPVGARGVRSDGRADPDLAALRGRRRDRHAGDAGPSRPGFEVAIVTGDKDFFQLVHDGIKVYNPKDEGTWFDADGVKEKFGVAPEQVVDVLALMGDSIDNIKGVPGIGEKGARDLIATYGDARDAARARGRGQQQALARRAAQARRRRAAEPRAGADPHRRAGGRSMPEVVRYRGASRERCFELFTRLGFRTLVMEFAPTARDRSARTTRWSQRSTSCARWPTELRAAGRFALRVLPDAPSAMRASIVGLSFSTAPRHARYVPLAGAARGRRTCSAASIDGERGARALDRDAALAVAEAGARRRRDREDRPRPEVRRDRARAARRRRCAGSRPTR